MNLYNEMYSKQGSEYSQFCRENEWKLNNETFVPEMYERARTFELHQKDPVPKVNFYAQQHEDCYIIQHILKEKITDGVFLEMGACDGQLYSCTKTLEELFNFSGILIEPQKHYYDQLIRNRPNCECYNYAISNLNQETISFIGNNEASGISETINETSLKYTNKNQITEVPIISLKDLLKKSKYEYIDIMIVDVEGHELSVLESVDWSFPIYSIFVEAHSNQRDKNFEFGKLLQSKGFQFHERQRGNEVWFNPNYFRKHLFQ